MSAEVSPGSRDSDLVDHVITDAIDTLSDEQIATRLDGLAHEPELSWSGWQFLLRVGQTKPQRVLDTLIARATSRLAGMRTLPIPRDAGDLLAGFDHDEYRDALGSVRDAVLAEPPGRARHELGSVYWALDRDPILSLEVLEDWLADPDLSRAKAAARLVSLLPLAHVGRRHETMPGWQLLLANAELVTRVIDGAYANGSEHLDAVQDALTSALHGGMSGRGMGELDERQVHTRDLASDLSSKSTPGTASRAFWRQIADIAEGRIAEDQLEDEEFGEDIE